MGILVKVDTVENAGNTIVEIWAGKVHEDISSQTITAFVNDTSAITAYKATNLGNTSIDFTEAASVFAYYNLYSGSYTRVGNGGWFAASQITGATGLVEIQSIQTFDVEVTLTIHATKSSLCSRCCSTIQFATYICAVLEDKDILSPTSF